MSALIDRIGSQSLLLQKLTDRVSALEETVKRSSELSADFDSETEKLEKKAAYREAPNKLSELRDLLSQIPD
ncbi:MAG: hypothetical protein ACLP00_08800 [Terracidiphilus sp.]